MTTEELGKNLKETRKYLKLNQNDVADSIGVKQNAVSNLETGNGGSIQVLLSVIEYYSQFLEMDKIMSGEYRIIGREAKEMQKAKNKIAIERIEIIQEDLNHELQEIKSLLK